MKRVGRLGGILGHGFSFGMRKIIPSVEQRRLAEHNPFAAGLKFIFNPVYSLEPEQFNGARCIAEGNDKPRTAPLPHQLNVGNPSADLQVNILGIYLPDRRKPAAVHMPEGIIRQQIVIRTDTGFLPEQFTPFGANAFQVFNRCL